MDTAGLAERIAGRLARGRSAATAAMPSRATVRRRTGRTVKVDGYTQPEWADVHVDIPFKLGGTSTGDGGTKAVTVAGVTFNQATAVGQLPWDTTNLADGYLIDITAGEWAGSVFQIVEAVKVDQRTARRVPVVEVPRPEEWA